MKLMCIQWILNMKLMAQCVMRVTFTRDFPGLGDRIREAREKLGKSATQMAGIAGISASQWTRIENEEVKALPEETLRAIESALGVDLDVAIDETIVNG